MLTYLQSRSMDRKVFIILKITAEWRIVACDLERSITVFRIAHAQRNH